MPSFLLLRVCVCVCGTKNEEEDLESGTKKEHKPKLLSSDIFRWGRGLPREGVGAKKFDMSLESRELKLFWRDTPGFCWDIPEVPEKFEKKKFVFKFWPHGVLHPLPSPPKLTLRT